MAWSGFPVEGLTLLNDLRDQTQQLHDAMVERAYADRLTKRSSRAQLNFPDPVPAEALQRIPWRSWQLQALGYSSGFLDPAKVAGYSIEGMTAAEAESSHFTSYADVYAAAGLRPEGFTRKRPWTISDSDAPDGTYALGGSPIVQREAGVWVTASERGHPDLKTEYGLAQTGDTIGPWLWNELRDVLNALKVSMVRAGIAGEVAKALRYGNNRNQTPQAAAAEALANTYDPYSGGTGGGHIRAEAVMRNFEYQNPSGGPWSATGNSVQSYFPAGRILWFADAPDYDADCYGLLRYGGLTAGQTVELKPHMVGLTTGTLDTMSFLKTLPDAKGASPSDSYTQNDVSELSFIWPPTFYDLQVSDFPAGGTNQTHVAGARIEAAFTVLRWDFEYA